jgi:hypothetical protein
MKVIKETKYLSFVIVPMGVTRKTKVVAIVALHHNEMIGEIRWFSKWRQYSFYPFNKTIWTPACLDDVNTVIKELMEERKKYVTRRT